MRKVMVVMALVGALAATACNTVRGVGRDVSSAGDAVQNSTR